MRTEEKVDAALLTLALVHASLGLIECYGRRRDYDLGISECRSLMRRHDELKLLSQVIEIPFLEGLHAGVLFEKGEAEYKARQPAQTPIVESGLVRYQGLAAADSYLGAISLVLDQGQHVARVESSVVGVAGELAALAEKAFHPLAAGKPRMTADDHRRIRGLSRESSIATTRIAGPLAAGAPRAVGPHQPLLTFVPPGGEAALRETSPLLYRLVLQARVRLLQLDAGLNFLGYRDDVVPPWRFRFSSSARATSPSTPARRSATTWPSSAAPSARSSRRPPPPSSWSSRKAAWRSRTVEHEGA